jgi:hypothetical protein
MKKCLIFLLFPILLLKNETVAQSLPTTNILLFDLENAQLSHPAFLTAWNQNGYNNQPAWLDDHQLLITVGQPSDTTQTEIWQLDLRSKTRSRVTRSTDSEFSPTPMLDNKSFSSVLIENDGQKTQRLWQFPLDRATEGTPIFPNIKEVGYHCWLTKSLVALFLIPEPTFKLVIADVETQKTTLLTSNPGRSLHRLSDGKLAFISKATEQTWYIKTWNPTSKTTEILCKTRPASEDFCVLADGSFVMGEASKLYKIRAGKDADWVLIADLSKYGVKKITRLAVNSAGKLAIVVEN